MCYMFLKFGMSGLCITLAGSFDFGSFDPLQNQIYTNSRFCCNATLFFMFVVPYILVTYMFNSSPTRCTLYSLFLSRQR
jgi:hypothetical protein